MKKALLVVNPSAGGEKAQEFQKAAVEKLESYFDEVEVKETKKGGDARDFARAAAQDKLDSVFVMGGDGTVNEGISGLAELDYRPKFGFFPLGTVNDLARALNMPINPKEAIEALDFEQTKSLDIGKINDRYFMNVVAVGSIPEAVRDVSVEEKTKFGKMAYLISGLKKIAQNETYNFELDVDGDHISVESTTLLIGLTNSIGGHENFLPDAKVDDGLLHLVYLKDTNMLESFQAVPNLAQGVTESNQNLGYRTFNKAHIALKNSQSLGTNVDGDEGDELPIDITILPSHLTVYSGK
ncbi:diacylglycerol/lipid kinase family protein [Streptococcus pluranimalium]|uniref:diacylglycerol/lipid kinase family protein n=1 Tax=Streptococcus pluranimalium TaxID=82348 RepID=UPI0024151CCB|nr:diacylglycerol kinase family protein [Streptococcus pluranimalium]MDY3041931.1 diacylglycerol kinase family lipid kinase [Streptococcus pluranimalium]WFM79733.1 diacylglycerol kinase family lipid kinase [Streptococcus pluranimalium]